VFSLVEESGRREGMRRLRRRSSIEEPLRHPPLVPWLKKVEKVKVREGSRVVYVRVFSKPILCWVNARNRVAKEGGYLYRVKVPILREVS